MIPDPTSSADASDRFWAEAKRLSEITLIPGNTYNAEVLWKIGLAKALIHSENERAAALAIARDDGQVDGAHHKAWAIDQMVRALTGCPEVEATAKDYKGEPYTFKRLGESGEYRAFIIAVKGGEDGPDTYGWDTGIAP